MDSQQKREKLERDLIVADTVRERDRILRELRELGPDTRPRGEEAETR